MEVLLGLMSAFHAHNWMFSAFSNLLLSCTYSPFPTLTTDGNDTGALETVESDGDMDMDEAVESEEENFHLKILHFWGRVMCQLDIFRPKAGQDQVMVMVTVMVMILIMLMALAAAAWITVIMATMVMVLICSFFSIGCVPPKCWQQIS